MRIQRIFKAYFFLFSIVVDFKKGMLYYGSMLLLRKEKYRNVKF